MFITRRTLKLIRRFLFNYWLISWEYLDPETLDELNHLCTKLKIHRTS